MDKIFIFFFFAFFLTACFDNSYGNAPVDPDIPQKLVIIHTTDSHAKYFSFWMEPNMFDRDLGLVSSNPPCWDLDYKGGASYCNGAYNSETGLYQVWLDSKYQYLDRKTMKELGYFEYTGPDDKTVMEDINEDGTCDVQDCQRCWDKNSNNVCDDDEDVDGVQGCSVSDCEAQKDNEVVSKCWDTTGGEDGGPNGKCDSTDDINHDKACGFDDCALVYDRDHDKVCDYPYDTSNLTWKDESGQPILRKNYSSDSEYNVAITNAKANSEDINRDGVCDYRDYHPGLVNSGNVARVKTVVDQIRADNSGIPVLQLDSGDAFQGAPEFNLYKGALEMLSIQKLGVDAMAIGNHEFDNGTSALVSAYRKSGGFPLLASNYIFDLDTNKGLLDITSPYIILMRGSLRIGIVGLGNDSSLNSIYQIGGSLGFNAMDPVESAQKYVNVLRPLVDIVILLSHQGLDGDYELAQKVSGVDIILGGHHHVVLNPPKVLEGPDGRDVVIVHSGVNFKVVGELDLAVQNKKVVWYDYVTHAITDDVQENGDMVNLLKPYAQGLEYSQYLDKIIGTASSTISRTDSSGGDSPLGNLVTDAMMSHELASAQFCVTNSMGIRADIPTGDITIEKLYEVFPFENTLTTMYLSGTELKTLFDYVARRSASRGCKTQVQVAGIGVELDCSPDEELQDKYGSYALTKCLTIGDTVVVQDYKVVQPYLLFKMATNDYMGRGGSGFYMLENNTTRLDTSVSIRDAVSDYIQGKGTINPLDYSMNQTGENECGQGKRIKMLN